MEKLVLTGTVCFCVGLTVGLILGAVVMAVLYRLFRKRCVGTIETTSYKSTPMLQDWLEQMQLYDVYIFNTPVICRSKRTFP